MKANYRYSLKKSDSIWFGLSSGSLIESTTPVHYVYKFMANWKDLGIIDERNMRMGGFTRTYTEESCQFVSTGAEILRQVWMKYGNNGSVTLYVERLNRTTQEYEYDYKTAINLATSQDSRDYFAAKLLDDAIAAKIKTREDVIYEMPATVPIDVASLRVLGEARWLTGWPIRGESSTGSFEVVGSTGRYKITAYHTEKILVGVSDTPGNQPISFPNSAANNYVSGQDFSTATGGENYLIKANVPLSNVKFTAQVNYYVKNNNTDGFSGFYIGSLIVINSSGVMLREIQGFNGATLAPNAEENSGFTFNTEPFSMAVGERLALTFAFSAPGASTNRHSFTIEKDDELKVTFEHTTNAFQVKGESWFDVGKYIVDKITDGEATFKSDLLSLSNSYSDFYDLMPSRLYILSGDSIRGIPDAKLKISLKDYLKAAFVMMGAGFGIEGAQCVLEKYEYFFKSSAADTISNLDQVQEVEIEAATEFNYNSIVLGYKEYNYDSINGKDEPNTNHQYLMPVTNDKNELNLISPVRADGYGIFYTWVKNAFKDKQDSESDNDLFALQVTPTSVPLLSASKRATIYTDFGTGATISGVLSTNTMNLGLTPERCARRLGRYIQSCYFNQDSEVMKYQSTDKNASLVSKLSTPTITANADIPLSALGARIFYPIYINPMVNSPVNYRLLWDNKKNGNFKLRYRNKTFTGFPIQTCERNQQSKVVNFKLLAADLGV